MTLKLKLAAYVILIALAIWFWHAFHSSYSKITPLNGDLLADAGSQPSNTGKPENTNQLAPASGQTNISGLSTNNSAPANAAAASNLVKQSAAPTNATAAGSPSKTALPVTTPSATTPQTKPARSVGSLVAFVGAMIGLGLLAAYDISQFFGARAVDLLFNDQGLGQRDPEYEKAEQAWVAGRHLEAIEMMREYLTKHPRELYVSLRIAEIYEKDLRNYVAASLEYEEVLKKRLPDERWGWAAIHLCNIYSKLGKPDKTKALLERIAREYPKTGAAKKARRNLGLPEPVEETAPVEETQETAEQPNENADPVFDLDEVIASTEEEAAIPPEAKSKTPPPPDPAKPNLPPGFRRK